MAGAGPKACTSFRSDRKRKDAGLYAINPEGTERSRIVLIPEIALTYQTVRRFYAMFGDKVSVLNSRLSQGERYDQFKRAKRGEIQVMVGPRSALFHTIFQIWG